MDLTVALALLQEGIVNGAIYGLLALALIIVFSATRIILVPIGEFAVLAVLTLASLEAGHRPSTLWLLAGLSCAAAAARIWRSRKRGGRQHLIRDLAAIAGMTVLAFGLSEISAALGAPQLLRVALTVLIILPMGPYLYDLAYRPVANANVMSLLIVSVALHLALMGVCFMLAGHGGVRTTNLADASMQIGPVHIGGQSLVVMLTAAMLVLAVYLFLERSLIGKALRATAMSRTGARLVAIPPALCGHLSFGLAAGIGALAGILISAASTVHYDTGFLMALKGFVAAVIGGLASYPLAAVAALLVGAAESLAAFSLAETQEFLVLMGLVPVLLWRSWMARHSVEEGEE